MLQNLAVEMTNVSVELNAYIISWIVNCFDGIKNTSQIG